MGADGGAVDAVVAAVRHDLGQRHGDRLPDPGFAPPPEPPIDGVPTAIFGGHVTPRRSTAEPPENAVDDRAVLFGRPASAPVLRLDGQQTFQNAPFRFGEITPAQACLQKAVLNQALLATSMLQAAFLNCAKSGIPPTETMGRSLAEESTA